MRCRGSIALVAFFSFATTAVAAEPRWIVPSPEATDSGHSTDTDPADPAEPANPAFRVITDDVYIPRAPDPEPEPEPEPEPLPAPAWIAPAGASVQETIVLWGAIDGWAVLRQTSADYRLVAPLSYSGSFLDAVQALLLAHAEQPRPLRSFAYPNQQPNPLLVVTE